MSGAGRGQKRKATTSEETKQTKEQQQQAKQESKEKTKTSKKQKQQQPTETASATTTTTTVANSNNKKSNKKENKDNNAQQESEKNVEKDDKIPSDEKNSKELNNNNNSKKNKKNKKTDQQEDENDALAAQSITMSAAIAEMADNPLLRDMQALIKSQAQINLNLLKFEQEAAQILQEAEEKAKKSETGDIDKDTVADMCSNLVLPLMYNTLIMPMVSLAMLADDESGDEDDEAHNVPEESKKTKKKSNQKAGDGSNSKSSLKWSEEDEKKAIELRANGKNLREIGEILGRSAKAVSRILSRNKEQGYTQTAQYHYVYIALYGLLQLPNRRGTIHEISANASLLGADADIARRFIQASLDATPDIFVAHTSQDSQFPKQKSTVYELQPQIWADLQKTNINFDHDVNNRGEVEQVSRSIEKFVTKLFKNKQQQQQQQQQQQEEQQQQKKKKSKSKKNKKNNDDNNVEESPQQQQQQQTEENGKKKKSSKKSKKAEDKSAEDDDSKDKKTKQKKQKKQKD